MKVIFTSNRLVDFLIRLSITAIVISPVIIWSWDTVKETTADGMLAAAFVILYSGVLLFILYFCFHGFFFKIIRACSRPNVSIAGHREKNCFAFSFTFTKTTTSFKWVSCIQWTRMPANYLIMRRISN